MSLSTDHANDTMKEAPATLVPVDVSRSTSSLDDTITTGGGDVSPETEAGGGVVSSAANDGAKQAPSFRGDWRFWMIMLTLSLGVMLVSLETTVVITSLPTIAAELGIGKNYIWVSNAFLLASTALIPLFGQLCNLFGRRNVLVFIFGAYTLGSGIAGGANGAGMLIAGRVIQGIGSGGLNTAADVVISDLVPLRYRGNYIAMLLLVGMVGFAIGPVIGGLIVERTSWRWVFYINLPIGGLGMLSAWFFLGNLQYDRRQSVLARIRRIDWIGNLIIIASTVSILIALTWAGTLYEWSDYQILVPLILGLAGLGGFVAYEASGIPSNPVVPIRLFPNWTSRIVYANTFINTLLIFWCFFFFPLYFQAVLLSSPSWSGVQIMPITLVSVPGAAMSAMLLTRFGKFKLLHVMGFLLLTIGGGSLAVLEKGSSTGVWVGIQIVPAVGSGFLLNTLLPAFQASTAEEDQAAATSSWSFIRTFGFVWGVAVAGTVFNTSVRHYAHKIDDAAVRHLLSSGDAYASATKAFVTQFENPLRDQIREVFMLALRRVFIVSVAFGGITLLLSLMEKDIPLREELDTKYGMEERQNDGKELPEPVATA